MKTDILGFNLLALETALIDMGEKPFRGRQIAGWIYKHKSNDFLKMTNICAPLRDKLSKKFLIGKIQPLKTVNDKSSTCKTLWELADGESIESVLIPDKDRLTLCISTQVGCPLNCQFCATGRIGFRRNLAAGEIINQFLQTELGESERITNVVFMGMGEPLLNFDNLLTALEVLIDDLCIGFGARKITVSTAGIPPKIRSLADSGLNVGLAFSLNAASDHLRDLLMPINRRFKLQDNLEALQYYHRKINRRITFEYVLIKGINDSLKDAADLAEITRGIPCKINLIRYNPIDGSQFRPPDNKTVYAFRDFLYPRTPAVTLRESKGANIAAACGQLKAFYSKRET